LYRLPPGVHEPEFAALLRYWESKRRDGRLPSRADIDPIEIRGLLPHLLLFELVRAEAALRFRFRLAGTAFTHLVGRDVTGLCLDELGPPERVAPVHNALAAAANSGRPAYLAGRLTLRSQQYMMAKRLGVPLAADGRTVDMILGVWLAQQRPRSDLAAGRMPEDDGGEIILLQEA